MRIAAIFIGLLLLGVGIQIIPKRIHPRFPPTGPLPTLIPGHFEGWTVKDLPLGETEFLKKKVEGILRYDDYAYRAYRRGDTEISFYVAYWKPGSSDIIEVGSHSPDLCWPQNGWVLKGRELEQRFTVSGRTSELGQVRTFQKGDSDQYVLFWHLMGGKRSGYAQGDQTKWSTRAPAIYRNLMNTNLGFTEVEQYFIRITSNKPLAEVQREPMFEQLLKSAAQFGLFGANVNEDH